VIWPLFVAHLKWGIRDATACEILVRKSILAEASLNTDSTALATLETFLVVEDDDHYAGWLKTNIESFRSNCGIVGAPSRAACLEALKTLKPTWAFVDLHLPDGSGIDIVADILRHSSSCKVLVITAIEDPELAISAIQAGALGYLVKSHANWALSAALDEIERGGMPLTPLMAKRVLDTLLPARKSAEIEVALESETPQADHMLTDREKEILTLATRGYRNKEIAVRLDLSPNTVATHIKTIYRKMNVHSRSHMRRIMSKDE
jgi:DNA-binding NarL/FixJ family response regulator